MLSFPSSALRSQDAQHQNRSLPETPRTLKESKTNAAHTASSPAPMRLQGASSGPMKMSKGPLLTY
jgi:hypothetical protein